MKTVLIVDDSKTVRMMNAMLLKKLHCRVIEAEDGKQGVELALREQPDLILMDFMMPNLNGMQAVQVLRDDPATRDIPVIMITTRGEEEHIRKGLNCGATQYMTKPVKGPDLVSRAQQLLNGPAQLSTSGA